MIIDDENDPLEKFIGMAQLRLEMKIFFTKNNFILRLINEEKNWKLFVKLLKKILTDQPINKPIENIESFSFKNGGYVIKFTDTRGEYKVIDIY